jgi:hypothetical protein
MQSSASKRVLSTLASRIHPQLPLSPRESQQLLSLLTSSFRAHLDHAHPLAPSESDPKKATRELAIRNVQRNPYTNRPTSSYDSATQHMDSILNNPLFAVKPRRRGSGSAATDIMNDPFAWFVEEMATGSATLPKAYMCLELLEKAPRQSPSSLQDSRSPATVLIDWLRSSGTDTSRQFLNYSVFEKTGHSSAFLHKLVALLVAENETTALWRWFIRPNEQRVKETGLDVAHIARFRRALLIKMVSFQANASLTGSLTMFMQAFRLVENDGYAAAYDIVRPAGGHLINRIISNTNHSIDPELFDSFLLSTPQWLGEWSRLVQSMLWLHHPSEPSAVPGLRFVKDPAGAIRFINAPPRRRNYLIQLCLGVARQLIDQEQFADAQIVMEFTKEHFADIVLSKPAAVGQQSQEQKRARYEEKNLRLLDRLILT